MENVDFPDVRNDRLNRISVKTIESNGKKIAQFIWHFLFSNERIRHFHSTLIISFRFFLEIYFVYSHNNMAHPSCIQMKNQIQ